VYGTSQSRRQLGDGSIFMASGWPGKGHGALLKNPSTSLPGLVQGLKDLAIAVFWPGYLGVWMRFWTTDHSYNDFFNRLAPCRKLGE
jgi:hypothetical protein